MGKARQTQLAAAQKKALCGSIKPPKKSLFFRGTARHRAASAKSGGSAPYPPRATAGLVLPW